MTTPGRPVPPATPDARWWIRPALIAGLNIAVVVVAITFLVGWSAPAVLMLLVGFAFGTWWFLDQRPRRD